jgi:hypothetical protein
MIRFDDHPELPNMKKNLSSALLAITAAWLVAAVEAQGQTGPFPDNTWPSTIDTNAIVDYGIYDPGADFTTTPSAWIDSILSFGGGGDENMDLVTIDGLAGEQAQDAFVNPADSNYPNYQNMPVVDILVQVWGNSAFYTSTGAPINLSFLEGYDPGTANLVTITTNTSGQPITMPAGLDNSAWNWLLIPNIPNPINTIDGNRVLGDTNANTDNYGGINGGTVRFQNNSGGELAGLTIRALAIGPAGSFGTTNQVNVFAPPPVCAPPPAENLTWIDFNENASNNLTIISNADLGYEYNVQAGTGPANDLRTAVQCTSGQLDFGIESNYLGYPCQTPTPMKVCVEFYDDPNLAGNSFGPGTYATDDAGDTANFVGADYTLTGSGKWLRVAFWVTGPPVDLAGINTAPLTGGPILIFNGTAPFIDRFELGIERTGTNALAGLDPDPSFLLNPLICDTNYGYFAEWAPYLGITNNLTIGGSGGDQNMAVQMAGPTNDQRLSEAPAPGSGNNNLQFALENNVFGPTYQDNADVIMIYTYYDDPALAGATLYPQVYTTLNFGASDIIPPPAPYNTVATLKGTGQWVDAYFELPNVNFAGVNQGPQSVVRFETSPPPGTNTAASIFVSRVRYDVVRPCGPFEGINMLQNMSITGTNNQSIAVKWFGTAAVQSAIAVQGPYTTSTTTVTNVLTNSYSPPGLSNALFFRLIYPSYPGYLSTNTP